MYSFAASVSSSSRCRSISRTRSNLSCRSMIRSISERVSGLNSTISSTRLRNSGRKWTRNSPITLLRTFRLSVTTIEEQGILESFSRLPQAEREIVRQLLDEFGSQRVVAIRFPVPFGPKSISERRRFLSPIYKLIRYHRLIFDSVADGAFRSTYLPWIDSI